MQRSAAALGSAVFFVAAPGTVAGLVPWLITGWQVEKPISMLGAVRIVAGIVILVAAVMVLVRAFARFVVEGRGTPAPIGPTKRLVVGGDYRFVRNPMYLAVVSAVFAQAMIFGSVALLLYGVAVWAVMAAFVRWYEEPGLRERYGAEYDRYCSAVRAWLPRLQPWQPDLDQASKATD
jgi:protein-S-isoprenylcysteine O-methyltransferase Ste14